MFDPYQELILGQIEAEDMDEVGRRSNIDPSPEAATPEGSNSFSFKGVLFYDKLNI